MLQALGVGGHVLWHEDARGDAQVSLHRGRSLWNECTRASRSGHSAESSPAEDGRRITQVVQRLQSAGVPALFLHGNHDVPNLDRGTLNRLLGRHADYESLDYRGVHLVLLNSQDPTFTGGGGTLSDAQLAWLEADLQQCSGPVLVFCHHPLDEQDVSQHWYFPSHPGCALAVNRERARAIFARSGKVRAVFAGHMHWNHTAVIDGIPYVTIGSLVETRLTGGQPSGGFAEVTIEQTGRIAVEVRGRLPMKYVHEPCRRAGQQKHTGRLTAG